MSVSTQYNPNAELNAALLAAGASKTVYALVTRETENAKREALGIDHGGYGFEEYLDMFRGAWTKKQDALHEKFFQTWLDWSKPVVNLPRAQFPFYYPTAGASEALRHLIYDLAAKHPDAAVHAFVGEYEGYKAIAEAAGLEFVEHRREQWTTGERYSNNIKGAMNKNDLFFLSQPSAIDGNVWHDYNEFILSMPDMSVVVDVTYVGAVPRSAVTERFDLGAASIRNIVFSLSKPFGVYYDRIGGVFARNEDPGLFGNKWFKNLTSLSLGTKLMERKGVFDLPRRYRPLQEQIAREVSSILGFDFIPSDVFLLATQTPPSEPTNIMHNAMAEYLTRAGKLRLCLTPGMARALDTAGGE
jgi:hypothetical protein